MNIDKLNMANLVGEVMDKIVEFHIFFPSGNYTKGSNNMVFGFEKLMDFALDIDKLDLANLVSGEGDGQDHGLPDLFAKV